MILSPTGSFGFRWEIFIWSNIRILKIVHFFTAKSGRTLIGVLSDSYRTLIGLMSGGGNLNNSKFYAYTQTNL